TTFGGYDYEAAARALAVQAEQLRVHGVLVVRDFVDPGQGEVLLDIPNGDGDGSNDPRTASTSALFERFAREFRVLSTAPGFQFACVEGAGNGWCRYRVTRKLAAEFLLRKDYRTDWESEVKEEYTYFSQAEFEALFARLGLRRLASPPLYNPWIVRHRFIGRAELRDLDGKPVDFPPTNYVIVGEKVPPGEGVRFREAGPAPPLNF